MPVRAEVVLSDEEREVLERWARRPKSSQALALRCRIVLAAAEGAQSQDIAAALGCNASTVGKWRARFAERGIDGLHDEPRPGGGPKLAGWPVVSEAACRILGPGGQIRTVGRDLAS